MAEPRAQSLQIPSGKEEREGWSHLMQEKKEADFQDKIVHLDEEIAKEPTKKLTQRFQWLPISKSRHIGDSDSQDDLSDYSGDSDDYNSSVGEISLGIRTTKERESTGRETQAGGGEGGGTITRRATHRHKHHHHHHYFHHLSVRRWRVSRHWKRMVKIIQPCFRWSFVCFYVAAMLWSCDSVIDSDFTAGGVALRGVPSYLAMCFIFSLLMGGRQSIIPLLNRLRCWGPNNDDLAKLQAPAHRIRTSAIRASLQQQRPLSSQQIDTQMSVLRAISQPTLGGTMYARRNSRKLRDATEGLRVLGETDWQNLIEVDPYGPRDSSTHHGVLGSKSSTIVSVRQRGRVMVSGYRTFRELCKRELRAIANNRGSVLGTIVRNLMFCLIVFFTISKAERATNTDPWNYSGIPRELRIWDAVLQWALVCDHLICFLSCTSRLNYLMRFKTIVDVLTLPLLYKLVSICYGSKQPPERLLFSVIRLLRLFRLESLVSYSIPSLEPVSLILGGLAIDSAIILTSFACIMYLIESPVKDLNFDNIGDYLYYAVVTMTTVGYGDYSPRTRGGRWVTMAAILTAFIVLPYQVQRLLSALHIPPSVVGYHPPNHHDYILVYGKIRPRPLGVLLHEVASSLPDSINHVWVITPFPANSFRSLISQFLREYKIRVGVTQKYPTTEELTNYAGNAKAVYILGDPLCTANSSAAGAFTRLLTEDQKTFLRTAKIQPICWPRVPINVQLVHGMYGGLTAEMGAYVIVSMEALKLRCIARSVADCPGFIPLVFNWFQTPSEKGRVMMLLNQLNKRKHLLTLPAEFTASSVHQAIAVRNAENKHDEPRTSNPVHPVAAKQKVQRVVKFLAESPQTVVDAVAGEPGSGESTVGPLHQFHPPPAEGETPPPPDATAQVTPPRVLPDEINFYNYFLGLKFHAYRMDIPECFYGLDYSLVARTLYRRYNVFLIGLVSYDKKVYLNPVGHVLGAELGVQAIDHHLDDDCLPNLPLAGIVLSNSLEVVCEINSLKSLSIHPNSIQQEQHILTQNLRTPANLITATKTFVEDVKIAREDATRKLKGSNSVNRQVSWWADSSVRGRRVTSGFNGATPQPRRKVLDIISPGQHVPKGRSLETVRYTNEQQLTVPPPQIPEKIAEERVRRDDSSSSESSDEDDAVIKEVPDAVTFYEQQPSLPLILCCGWPCDLYSFLCALSSNGSYKVLVLSSHDAPSWGRWNRDLRSFSNTCAWLHGSPLSLEELKSAGALFASSIIIFSDAHSYTSADEPGVTTTNDNQTVLVRQQLFALFSRVEEYLQQQQTDANQVEGHHALKIPFIFTELQERESIEYLSSHKDQYLMRALRHVASRKEIGAMMPKNDDERGEDAEWMKEGGRAQGASAEDMSRAVPDAASSLKFQFNRSGLDSSNYVVQSEYRAGRIYLREMAYSLVGFGLPVSRFSMDVSLIEHAIDGSQSPVCEYLTRVDLRCKRLERYKWSSPIQLIPLPKILCNSTFKESFNYFFKFHTKLPIGVLRKLSTVDPHANGGPLDMFSSHSNELTISCPSPTFQLMEGDRLYVILPTPKHALGMLLCHVDL